MRHLIALECEAIVRGQKNYWWGELVFDGKAIVVTNPCATKELAEKALALFLERYGVKTGVE